jgi:hypothetical protein
MKGNLSEREQEFFLTGAKTCLDVMEALEEFQRQVQERCRETVNMRLKDLSGACLIEWNAEDLRDYSETRKKGADLAHFLGVKIAIQSLGELYFYLGMSRDDGKLTFVIWTQLWRRRQSLASDLWTVMVSSELRKTTPARALPLGRNCRKINFRISSST